MTFSTNDAGIVLVATGEKYIQESLPLVRSIRHHMPDIHVRLFTDTETQVPDNTYDSIEVLELDLDAVPQQHKGFTFRDLALAQSPFQYTIHMDTDTILGAPIYEIFHGLHRYELMVAPAPAKVHKFGDDEPDLVDQDHQSFIVVPRINCGFIAYSSKIIDRNFFENWVELYHKGIAAAKRRNRLNYSDQSVFRRMLWTTDVNFHVLSPEYNLRTGAPQYLDGHVKLAHGRPPMGRENLIGFINSFQGRRLYVPYRELIYQPENKNWNRDTLLKREQYTDWFRENGITQSPLEALN